MIRGSFHSDIANKSSVLLYLIVQERVRQLPINWALAVVVHGQRDVAVGAGHHVQGIRLVKSAVEVGQDYRGSVVRELLEK